ncbi:oxidoreductase [Fibrobacter sp. UWB2]|uniref:Gfo/Idh/MocA family protein n=1 Tax=Fibrobacter sp. UWB2 TaxID=1964358 RepID=UPI000B52465D|nr:Gfo/Idh/MocA family oxidoreductase [Fibrobacter sp. UWB2]OWV21170.1 oxidoreductase [Fibrobacter sp. UWB2]
MRRDYKAVLFGNGTMGERHRKFFEYSDVQFLKIFDLEDLDCAGNVRASLVDEFVSKDKVDFAVIASPATTHYEYAKLCLERGISVFVEKPLATLGAQAQELVDLAIRNNVILFVAQSECFNSVFLNFRKHFMAELGAAGNAAGSSFRLEFRREHKYSARCRDVNVALDLLVHDLSLCLSMFRYENLKVEKFTISKNEDRAQMQISIAKGSHAGAELDFIVDRNSDIDVRTISVEFGGDGGPACDYSVSLAPHDENGEVIHVSDSLENEHKFFLKLMAGACSEWGRRAAQSAANAVKLATISTASS